MFMKPLFLTGLMVTCFLVRSSPVAACYCARTEVKDAFKQAQSVFVGEVTDIVEPKNPNAETIQERFFTIKFKIEKSWKGVPLGTRELGVLAAQGRYGCFAFPPMHKGERYLVYADPTDSAQGWSVITTCTRTTAIMVSAKPSLAEGAIDPFADMKKLDAITTPL